MKFFHMRPALRLNMALFEAKYRKDTKDKTPLSREDRQWIRSLAIGVLRQEIEALGVPPLPSMFRGPSIH